MFITGPGLLLPGFQRETVDWLSRCEKRDPLNYVIAIDSLIRRGKQHGWWDRIGDIMIHGSQTLQASLEGLKGFFRFEDMTVNGTVSQEYRYGITAADNASFINTNKTPAELPGVTLNKHSLGSYVTSQNPTAGSECGATGTAGLKNFGVRASTGFRDNVWLGCDTVIFGGAVAVGFVMGVRTDSSGGFAVKNGLPQFLRAPAVSLSTNTFGICKTNPSAVSSANRILMTFVGGGDWTDAEAEAFYNDFIQFVRDIGIYGEIRVEPDSMGEACFGNNAIEGVVPSNMRVLQLASPPLSNTVDFDTYSFFPVTDVWSRPYTIANKTISPLEPDPITTVSASGEVTVNAIAHGAAVGDAISLSSLTAGNGFTAEQLNRQQIITEVVDVNNVKVIPGGTANASGAIGGSDGSASIMSIRLQSSTWTPPHDGGFYAFVWMNRGERAVPGGPIVSWTQKGNDLHPGIVRRTGAFDGVSCRLCFTTHSTAIGAYLVYVAALCGYADRDDPDDPLGQGYLDIAEAWGLNASDVITWQTACDTKETLFDQSVAGFAVCYDKAVLPPKNLTNVSQFSRRGVIIDLEHVDFRTPELHTQALLRGGQIAHAKNMEFGIVNHRADIVIGARSGWTRENAPVIINDPNVDFAMLFVKEPSEGDTPTFHMDAQLDFFRDAEGNVPIDKILVGCTLGTGQNQIPLDKCEAVGQWMQEKGITRSFIQRAASTQGGHELRTQNQQTIRYLPNLSTQAVTAPQFADAWDRKVTVSAPRKTIITDLISGLITDGIWWKIDYLAILAGENETQALTDIRGRLLSTTVNSPTFTASQGYAFNGTTQYIETGFIPKTMGIHMGADNSLLGVWERTNVGETGKAAAGAIGSAIDKDGFLVNPRSATDNIEVRNNSFLLSVGGSTTSVGSTFVVREAGGIVRAVRNGIIAGGAIVAGLAPLVSREVYVGACNVNNVPLLHRACNVPAVVIGSSMTADEYLALHNRIHTALQAIGAI